MESEYLQRNLLLLLPIEHGKQGKLDDCLKWQIGLKGVTFQGHLVERRAGSQLYYLDQYKLVTWVYSSLCYLKTRGNII